MYVHIKSTVSSSQKFNNSQMCLVKKCIQPILGSFSGWWSNLFRLFWNPSLYSLQMLIFFLIIISVLLVFSSDSRRGNICETQSYLFEIIKNAKTINKERHYFPLCKIMLSVLYTTTLFIANHQLAFGIILNSSWIIGCIA